MKRLKKFNTQEQFEDVKCDLERTVCMVKETKSVHVENGNYIIATYNVTSTTSDTKLLGLSYTSLKQLSKMYVDDVEVTPDIKYLFTTIGEHKVKFVFCEVTDMYNMFYYCSNLISLDVSGFDTSNVTNMSGVFYNCDSLTSLDLSSFDTSNVTTMSDMFRS